MIGLVYDWAVHKMSWGLVTMVLTGDVPERLHGYALILSHDDLAKCFSPDRMVRARFHVGCMVRLRQRMRTQA